MSQSTNPLDVIKESERKAEEMVASAASKAQDDLIAAQKEAEEKMAKEIAAAKEGAAEELKKAKQGAAGQAGNGEGAKKEIVALRKKAERNLPKAARIIIARIFGK